jgi:hypothetical protein
MSATVDRPARPLLRLSAAVACLVVMAVAFLAPPLASASDAGAPAEAASKGSCDARHSDSAFSHPDHGDESLIPVVVAPDGLGLPRRLCLHSSDGWSAVPQKPPVRPPSF